MTTWRWQVFWRLCTQTYYRMWEYTLRKTINIFALLIQTLSNIISHLINFYFRISFTSSAQGVHLAKSTCLKNETKPEEKKKEKKILFFLCPFFSELVNQNFTEAQNMLSWKWTIRIIESKPQPCIWHPKESQNMPESTKDILCLILAASLAVFSPKKLREYSE